MEVSKNISIDEYAIKLVKSKKLSYNPIYTFSSVELETLKIYIKTHLKIRFISLSKSPFSVFIFYNKKPDGSFYLYINYQGLKNLTIKN